MAATESTTPKANATWLTATEVMERLCINVPTLADYIHRQELPATWAKPTPSAPSDLRGLIHMGPKGQTIWKCNLPGPDWELRDFMSNLDYFIFRLEDVEKFQNDHSELTKKSKGKCQEPQGESETKSAKTYKTILGSNIDKYKTECGWSYDDLQRVSGLDKKLIIGHVKGKGMRPSTLKTYADTFSKGLKRPITPADLEN